MFIQVVCQNPRFPGRSRARRRFENGVVHRMEVVDQVDDFFTDKAKTIGDMARINRAGYEAIKLDPCFSVLADGETHGGIGAEMLDSARARVTQLAGKVAELEIENEGLKAANVRLDRELVEARLLLDAATKTEGEAPPPAEAKPEDTKAAHAGKPKK